MARAHYSSQPKILGNSFRFNQILCAPLEIEMAAQYSSRFEMCQEIFCGDQ